MFQRGGDLVLVGKAPLIFQRVGDLVLVGKAPFILFQKSGNLVLVGKAPFIFQLAHVRVYNKYSHSLLQNSITSPCEDTLTQFRTILNKKSMLSWECHRDYLIFCLIV